MRWALLFAILLAGCSKSPVDRADADVDFLVAHNGTNAELCDAYSKLVDAEFEARDAQAWDKAKLFHRIYCRAANMGIE